MSTHTPQEAHENLRRFLTQHRSGLLMLPKRTDDELYYAHERLAEADELLRDLRVLIVAAERGEGEKR
jgi:hypothetical protein